MPFDLRIAGLTVTMVREKGFGIPMYKCMVSCISDCMSVLPKVNERHFCAFA